MHKAQHIAKHFITSILLLVSVALFSQEDKLNRAEQLYRNKNTEQARRAIDSVIVHPQTKNDFTAWTVRAYIYYDTYKNLSKTLLEDSLNDVRSTMAYNKYKELTLLVNPSTDFTSKDIEFYLAVGSQYAALFIKDNNDSKSQNIAKVALMKVLELQPDNQLANLDMGLMHFNQAVNLSKSLDYGADFSQIDIVQDNMVKLAKQAEQFIVLVYKKDNNDPKALEALHYIYRMLNETAKSDDFKKKAEAQGVKFVDETVQGQK